MGKYKLRHYIGFIFWKLYVYFMWSGNRSVQKLLDKDTCDNLGYYLFNKTDKFNPKNY